MQNTSIVFLLVSLRSLFNIGSIFRTADALGADFIYLAGFTGTPKQSKIAKTALGAEKSVPWKKVKSVSTTIEELREQGYEVIALERTKTSRDYREWTPKKKTAILLGNEERGISPRVLSQCDKTIHLSMEGLKESLNVAVAAGAIGYYWKTF